MAKEAGIVFEVCPTSNVRTGTAPSYEAHPAIRMRDAGVAIALCSDDPALFGIDLTHELTLARERMGFDDAALTTCQRAAQAARFGVSEEDDA